MQQVKKFIALAIVLALAGLGPSLTMKAAIGLGAFDALNQTVAFATGFRVGDVLTILQIFFVVIQLLILKKEATVRILLQIPLAAIFGQIINFYFYTVLAPLVIENYWMNLALFLIGNVWIAFWISAVMALDLVTMPVENLAMVVANKNNQPFGKVRQGLDVVFIILTIIITFIFQTPLTIREGTIIATIIFGPLLTFFMPYVLSTLRKMGLVTDTTETA